jgi:hypothetical protein
MKYRSKLWNFVLYLVSSGTKCVPKRLLCDYESRDHRRFENHALPKAVKFRYLLLDFANSSVNCACCKRRCKFRKNRREEHKYYYYGSNLNYIYECTVDPWCFKSSKHLFVICVCSPVGTQIVILLKVGALLHYACLDQTASTRSD